jgi:4-amino-4-deoxy-L-arabinose transferase-like glycosyltransferase
MTQYGRTRRNTLAVLSIAIALRLSVLAVVLARYPKGWFFTRGIEMGLLAQSLLAGKGLASPFGGDTGPTAFIAPIYPLMVAAVFRVFGILTPASAAVIMGAQVVLALLAIYLIMRLARLLFSEAAALIAGLLWACSPPLVFVPTIFWETSLSICLLLGLLTFALEWQHRMSRTSWTAFGVLAAFTALVNPALLLVPPRRSITNVLLAACAFVIVFSPWPIRNARVFHAFIPMRTTVGFELWMGNRPGATGYLDQSLFPMYNRAELDDYIRRGELGYTQHKTALAQAFIRANPGTFASLTARRIWRFWSGTGSEGGSPIFALYAITTSCFGIAGLWLLWRRSPRAAWLMAAPLLLFPLPYYITHAEFRYRLTLDPVLAILAGAAIVAAWNKLARHPSTQSPAPAGKP